MSHAFKFNRKSDEELRKLIRGQSVRPAQRHVDRKKESKRRACRGKGDQE